MSVPNPLRVALLWVGSALANAGLVDRQRTERTTDLAWPRVVTGIARMSKNAVDVAMVGIAIGPAAIAGVGYGSAFWGMAFALGGGIAGGTISLVSQRYGAEAYDEMDLAVKVSAFAVVGVTVPVAALYFFFPEELMGLVASGAGERTVGLGAEYLAVLALGVPFAGLNLIGSRSLVGADDAWTPMILRGGGATVNIVINAVLIFGLDLGVVGAALGTVLANVLVAAAFVAGMVLGRLPLIGEFPVTVSLSGPYFGLDLFRDLVEISLPLVFTNASGNVGRFPLLFLVGLLGETAVAAYVIGRRVMGLLNTPGWGFSLASSSLVGQELGTGDETEAGEYARDILRFSVTVYAIGAVCSFVFARPIARLFVEDPETLPLATTFVRVTSIAVIFWGVGGAARGPLRASGDTRWPFYAKVTGLYLFAIPLAAAGALPPLEWGLPAIYASIFAEAGVPAAITYYRYATGKWKVISRDFRPDAAPGDD